MKKRTIFFIVVLVALAVLATIRLVSNKKKINEQKEVSMVDANFKIPVNVAEAAVAPFGSSITKTVSVNPNREAKIMVSQPGQIVKWNADLGARVAQGAVMGHIDIKQTQLKLNSAELALKRLEKDYKRYSELLEGGGVTEVNFDEVKFNYENTKIQVDQLKQQLEDSYVRAPFSGVVTMKMIELGEFANPGSPLAILTDVSSLKVIARLNEAEAMSIKEGDKATITLGAEGNQNVEGRVTYIAPRADAARSFEVEIVFPNPGGKIKAGGFATASFGTAGEANALLIPRTSIVESLKDPFVYMLKDGKATRRNIKVGREANGFIEVLEGIQPGEKVITTGQINLEEGTPVEPVEKK